MARFTLPLLILAALLSAACAGFQKGPDPLSERLDALRISQMAVENRLAAIETRLAELGTQQGQLAAGLAAQAVQESAPVAEAVPTQEEAPATPASQAPAAPPAAAPEESPQALYEDALGRLRQEAQPNEAKALFERFLELYPEHALAPNAMYWRGECLYDLEQFAEAVVAFNEVAAAYPEHHKAAAGLLKMGYSYLRLEDEANARDYLGRVVRFYPDSEEALIARAALDRIAMSAYASKEED